MRCRGKHQLFPRARVPTERKKNTKKSLRPQRERRGYVAAPPAVAFFCFCFSVAWRDMHECAWVEVPSKQSSPVMGYKASLSATRTTTANADIQSRIPDLGSVGSAQVRLAVTPSHSRRKLTVHTHETNVKFSRNMRRTRTNGRRLVGEACVTDLMVSEQLRHNTADAPEPAEAHRLLSMLAR